MISNQHSEGLDPMHRGSLRGSYQLWMQNPSSLTPRDPAGTCGWTMMGYQRVLATLAIQQNPSEQEHLSLLLRVKKAQGLQQSHCSRQLMRHASCCLSIQPCDHALQCWYAEALPMSAANPHRPPDATLCGWLGHLEEEHMRPPVRCYVLAGTMVGERRRILVKAVERPPRTRNCPLIPPLIPCLGLNRPSATE